MASQLRHSLYNLSKFVTFSVYLSQIPFVFPSPSFPFSLLSFTSALLHLSHFLSIPFISNSFPLSNFRSPSVPAFASHSLLPHLLPSITPPPSFISPSLSNTTRPAPSLNSVPEKKRQPMQFNYDYGSTKWTPIWSLDLCHFRSISLSFPSWIALQLTHLPRITKSNRPLSHGGHLSPRRTKSLAFARPASRWMRGETGKIPVLFQHCVIKFYSNGLIQLPFVSPEDWRSCHAQHSAWSQEREGVWNLDLLFRYYFGTPAVRREKKMSRRTIQRNNPASNGRTMVDIQQGNNNHWLDSIVRLGSLRKDYDDA